MKFITKLETNNNNNRLSESTLFFPEVDVNLDMVKLEEKVLEFWKKNNIFQKRVELNKNNPKNFSFLDGPITANNPMGLHHVWGRSFKDSMQRYWAMKGYKQRFQNGFDCQGLWIEVEVEKSLGLNSKKAIENYGLEEFSNKCKERIEQYSTLITRESIRLGQWMDWDNSYYTHKDSNISYIWHFLKKCHQNGWLIKDYSPMPWCIRCGTSLSQHEQFDSYEELTHTAVFVKFQLKEKVNTNEFLLIWTTTPWTLAANTAVAVNPDLVYCKVRKENEIFYLAKRCIKILKDNFEILEEFTGNHLLNKEYLCPFSYFPAQKKVIHKIIEWKDVSGDEGTGFVHIAPGCGPEDYELSKKHQLVILSPIDESGIFNVNYDILTGLPVNEASQKVIVILKEQNLLFKTEKYKHRYPTCWRCHEELVFRLVDEWFIDCKEIKPLLKEAVSKVEWIPYYYEKRMQDWLNNMGNWCISRKRYWGLPLPFFECKKCNKLNVIGSKEELLEKVVTGITNLPELHRPWIDDIKIRCEYCNEIVAKTNEVGDCWLDAGIVPFSTLRYFEDNEYWKKWFPVEAVCEMREQIRLWFYSLLFMSVTLIGKAPYKRVIIHEKVHDKDGKPMHRSWGNAIWFSEAVNKMGADVLRWAFIKQPLYQQMNFGYHVENEIKPFFMSVWNIYSFFATYANLDKFNPLNYKQNPIISSKQPLFDQWLQSKLYELINQVRKNLDQANFKKAIDEIEQFVEQISTWYIRTNRRRFWKNEDSEEKISAYLCLYETLLTLSKLIAPIAPFFSETLYRNLTSSCKQKYPLSVHLCDYPKSKKTKINWTLNSKMDSVYEVVKAGRIARTQSKIRTRQPLRILYLWCKNPELNDTIKEFQYEILTELNVKKLTFIEKPEQFLKFNLKPNYKILGSKLKKEITLLEKEIENLPQEQIVKAFNSDEQILEIKLMNFKRPLKLELNKDLELKVESIGKYALAISNQFVVALDTKITKELELEGLVRDFIRHIQELRKKCDFQINDKIRIQYYAGDLFSKAIEKYYDFICSETLAERIEKIDNLEKANQIKVQNEQLLIALFRID